MTPAHGTYKKLVIADGRLTGAVLVGDAGDALWYLELIRSRTADRRHSQGHDVRSSTRAAVGGGVIADAQSAVTALDAPLQATRTTCPYCGVGCGVLATPDGNGGAAIAGDPEHPANFGRLCSKGSALGETLGLDDRLLYPMIRCSKGNMERVAWSDALDHVAHRFAAHCHARRPRRGGVLSVGAIADRGLLRRQQADEGIHRQRQCRYQFAAVHGVLGRGPSPRLRRRHRARLLRGSRRGRSAGAGRLQRGVVPSGAVPAHGCQQAEARRAHRRDRSAPHRHRRGCRSVPRPEARQRHRAVLRAAGALADNGALDHGYIERHTSGFEEALARARAHCRQHCRDRASDAAWRESDVAEFFQMFAQYAARGHAVFARRQPVGAGHRQGQCHHQLPSGDGPDRQARRVAVLADRPAQRDGRTRGRRARQPARRAYGVHAAGYRSRAPVLEGAAHRHP